MTVGVELPECWLVGWVFCTSYSTIRTANHFRDALLIKKNKMAQDPGLACVLDRLLERERGTFAFSTAPSPRFAQ